MTQNSPSTSHQRESRGVDDNHEVAATKGDLNGDNQEAYRGVE